jgi:hypothetical protein
MTRETAAHRAAAMLREFDQNRRESMSRVPCVEPGCRSELLCRTAHADNLTATWRCLEHREDPNTPTLIPRKDTP